MDSLFLASFRRLRARACAPFNRRPYLYTWERRWWTVTTPWNYSMPFRARLLIAVRWHLPRLLGGWRHRGRTAS